MPQTHESAAAPNWARRTLYAAAVYNLVWGVAVIFAPMALFHWAEMDEPRYPQIWQCVGMIVGVYGIGYWLAAADPFRHWPIVLVGLVGKILGPIGFLQAALAGSLPWKWGITILTNDLIWWVPFACILYQAFRHNTDSSRGNQPVSFEDAIEKFRSQRNSSLLELSMTAPTVVVFVRHAGCTFCRVTMSILREYQSALRAAGVELALVHMGSPMDGTLMLQKYGLETIHHFSDPKCKLYRAFGLDRGRLRQLFSPRIVKHGLHALLHGHGLGKLAGDGFQMPGSFLLRRGKILTAHRALTADELPDFDSLLASIGAKLQHPKLSLLPTP